jgi:hypothetical protein
MYGLYRALLISHSVELQKVQPRHMISRQGVRASGREPHSVALLEHHKLTIPLTVATPHLFFAISTMKRTNSSKNY